MRACSAKGQGLNAKEKSPPYLSQMATDETLVDPPFTTLRSYPRGFGRANIYACVYHGSSSSGISKIYDCDGGFDSKLNLQRIKLYHFIV